MLFDQLKRREFITCSAARRLRGRSRRAQQPKMLRVGFLNVS
jgi:hypothetical protein